MQTETLKRKCEDDENEELKRTRKNEETNDEENNDEQSDDEDEESEDEESDDEESDNEDGPISTVKTDSFMSHLHSLSYGRNADFFR